MEPGDRQSGSIGRSCPMPLIVSGRAASSRTMRSRNKPLSFETHPSDAPQEEGFGRRGRIEYVSARPLSLILRSVRRTRLEGDERADASDARKRLEGEGFGRRSRISRAIERSDCRAGGRFAPLQFIERMQTLRARTQRAVKDRFCARIDFLLWRRPKGSSLTAAALRARGLACDQWFSPLPLEAKGG